MTTVSLHTTLPRIGVLVSGNGSNLQALIDARQAGLLEADIAVVVSNKASAYALTRARDANIDTVCVPHEQHVSRAAFDARVVEELRKRRVEWVVFAGFIGLTAAPGEAVVVPLLATQILWINLVTDSGPALAMGVDPEIDDVMARRPRRPDDRILDRAMWARIVSVGLVMAVITLAVYDACLPGGLFSPLADRVPVEDQFAVARTTAFTTLVLLQLFNAFNARSATASAFHRLFSNRWLWAAIGLAALLQVLVVEVPFLQVAFGTASLDLVHWLVALAAASLVLVYEEVVKVVRRARA